MSVTSHPETTFGSVTAAFPGAATSPGAIQSRAGGSKIVRRRTAFGVKIGDEISHRLLADRIPVPRINTGRVLPAPQVN